MYVNASELQQCGCQLMKNRIAIGFWIARALHMQYYCMCGVGCFVRKSAFHDHFQKTFPDEENRAPKRSVSIHIGRSWSSGYPLVAPTYMHVQPPNGLIGHYANGNSIDEGDFMISPSSRHRGGVNVALFDGSVRYVTDEVSEKVWWAVGSRNDGRTQSLP